MQNRIRDLRKAVGLTQQQLADAVGTSRVYITQIESGSRRLNEDTMEKIASALRVDTQDLIISTEASDDMQRLFADILALPHERRLEVARFVDFQKNIVNAA